MGSVAERNVVSGSISLRCGVYRQQLSLRAAKRRGNPQRRHSQDAIACRAISPANRNLCFPFWYFWCIIERTMFLGSVICVFFLIPSS